jgi:murein DD-endopeptidase MepM/ murein hydrolase activator NlpD
MKPISGLWLGIGERVKMGQVIGKSGNTGTTGGYFGSEGYYHLHMSVYAGKVGDYKARTRGVQIPDMQQLDPLAVYLLQDRKVSDNHAVRALPDAEKAVTTPYKTTDGRIVPAGTRLVWPFMCEPK